MAAFAARTQVVPEVLTAAWDRLGEGEAWTDDTRHEALLRLVSQNDAYAWAAQQYRTRAGDPIADRQLARIRKAAEATLFATAAIKRDTTPRPYRSLVMVVAMLAIAAIAGGFYAALMRDSVEQSQTNATQPVIHPTAKPHPPEVR
jgi:hypothetical protein